MSQVSHFRLVCEHGTVHAECGCDAPRKEARKMPCPTSEKCKGGGAKTKTA